MTGSTESKKRVTPVDNISTRVRDDDVEPWVQEVTEIFKSFVKTLHTTWVRTMLRDGFEIPFISNINF